jgi:steroid delta-isomerase-like uncharacterized protein
MNVEGNLRVIEAALEAYNAHDYVRFLEYFAESVVILTPGQREPLKGRDGMREWEEPSFADFPDLHVINERSLGQGDWVRLEWVYAGTHRGRPEGPGGKAISPKTPIRVKGCTLFKFEGGKITERRLYWDRLEMRAQLGLV